MSSNDQTIVAGVWAIGSYVASTYCGAYYDVTNIRSGIPGTIILSDPGETGLLRHNRDVIGFLRSRQGAHGIPRIYKYFRYYNNNVAQDALVMQRLGPSLHAIHRASGNFSKWASADIGAKVIEILQWMHRQGVVHTELTAKNVVDMSRPTGRRFRPYLIEFSCADIYHHGRSLAGSFISRRCADLYHLGKLLFFLRTGREFTEREGRRYMPRELRRYFEKIEEYQFRDDICYEPLQSLFEYYRDNRTGWRN